MAESEKPEPTTVTFKVSYDRRTDVLYISTRAEDGTEARMDKQGIVWRYTNGGELVGATIMDFYDRWYLHQPELADEISRRFHLPRPQAGLVVDHAFSKRETQ